MKPRTTKATKIQKKLLFLVVREVVANSTHDYDEKITRRFIIKILPRERQNGKR